MNTTLALIKPDIVANNKIGSILMIIEQNGFKIRGMKLKQMTPSDACSFYAPLADKPFFNDLVAYMTSGPLVALILERDDAVANFRKLIGVTDPKKAEIGTIRYMFGESIDKNAIHGSDSDENALREIKILF